MKRFVYCLGAGVAAFAVACSATPDASTAGGDEFGYDDYESGEEAATFKPGCTQKKTPAFALGGTILTPEGAIKGYVVVKDEVIVDVVTDKDKVPAGTPISETEGIISPGFIDLHNHVAYNFLPFWDSGRRWSNRYQWARADEYDTAVKDPYNAVKNGRAMCEAIKYGEFKALVGGTTSIQGSSDMACTRSWARNIEYTNFCADSIQQHVLPINAIDATKAASLNAAFASGKTKAFLVHLAEGIDDSSRKEFEQLRALGLLKPQVVGIHSTALTEAQLAEMGQIGMKIVWSPLSNLALYGKTTNIPAAVKAGVTVSLAPDWTPSGSANVLGELKIADRVNKEQFGSVLTDKQLWEMVTANPAKIVGLEDKLGTIVKGRYADLVVIRGNAANPYRAIIDAAPEDVVLTTVSGEAFYGEESVIRAIGNSRSYISVNACGQTRLLSVADPTTPIPNASDSLETVMGAFTSKGVTDIIPLFQCDTTSLQTAAFRP